MVQSISSRVITTIIAASIQLLYDVDMVCGEWDNSFFIKEDIQPDSMNTTDLIYKIVENISFVFHIGDMSYARGFSSVVSQEKLS